VTRARPTRCIFYLALLLAILIGSDALLAEETSVTDFDPQTGYRISRYRAPLPERMDGAARIFAADIAALLKEKNAVLIDVMPSEGGGADPETGQWRLIKPRQNIPNSTWLPDVGKGKIDERMDTYFKSNLDALTAGDKSRAIIIYCQSDCWMGWNAVRRVLSYGYTSIYWYPDGTDGWKDWDGAVVDAQPVPLTPQGQNQ
jgi:PQQ-dependent catabolism-associated CXXCW motif protein